jgi:flagellar hook assembly protein FlgD
VAVAVVATALLVAVWVAPRASGAAAAWLRTPPVHLRTLHAPGDGRLRVDAATPGRASAAPVTLDAGMRFTMAGVVCDRPLNAGAVVLRLRTSVDGITWGRWYDAPLEVADEAGSPEAFTDPVWTGEARYMQVSAAAGSRRGPTWLSDVRLVAIDPTEDADVATRVLAAVRHVAATVADLGTQDPAAAASVTQPVIVTRAEWGADESLRSGSPSYAPVKMAFVHHTDSGNTYTQADSPALVRGIYAYHTRSLGWSDIGYNFLVDRFGTIYEGRYGGITKGVIGAQVYGFNTGSTGISVMGTFTDVAPPPAALAALERLLAWKLSLSGLDPLGTADMICGAGEKFPKGAVVTLPIIAGHRDANFTECPGTALYGLLPSIRADVAKRIGRAGPDATLTASADLISPNGDGVLDTVELKLSTPATSGWRLSIDNDAGKTVASWSGGSPTATVVWDGRSGGKTVPDGTYTARLTDGAEVSAAPVTMIVDTTAPKLARASAAPLWFSPNGDDESETCAVIYAPAEACSVRVGIMDSSGTVVRWLQGWRARSTQTYSVTWDGRIASGSNLVAAPDGDYKFDIERRDAAGNVGRRGVSVVVDRTIGFPSAKPTTVSPNGDRHRDRTVVGFTLARAATVSVTIRVGDAVVRTVSLGRLESGARTFVWDGRNDAGAALPSSRPSATLTAVSSLGESSVTQPLVVDLYAPRLYAPKSKTGAPGQALQTAVKIADPFSAEADLRYTVVDAQGRRVASAHPGWVTTGTAHTVRWTPRARGVYTIVWRATDLGFIPESAPAATRVTVR